MRNLARGIPKPDDPLRCRQFWRAKIGLADEGRQGDSAANNFRPKM
jgi:hypothetical protein